jgi:integrase
MTHNTKGVWPYGKDEQEKLVTAFTEIKGNKLRFRYGWGAVLILETGLRTGESLALEWPDIDEGEVNPFPDKKLSSSHAARCMRGISASMGGR